MRKDDTLRAAVVAALPDLNRDAQALKVWLEKGSIASVGAAGIGWEYRYQLSLLLLDFTSDPDLLFHAILQWLRTEQPDLLMSPGALEKALTFEVDVLGDQLADILVTISLTESVQGVARPGGIEMIHPPLPAFDDDRPLAPDAPRLSSIRGNGQA